METIVEKEDVDKRALVDPFHPKLYNSPSLHHSDEQDSYIKMVLNKACSDSRFAQKAYDAIRYIMSQEEAPPEIPLGSRIIGEIPTKAQREQDEAILKAVKEREEHEEKVAKEQAAKIKVEEEKAARENKEKIAREQVSPKATQLPAPEKK